MDTKEVAYRVTKIEYQSPLDGGSITGEDLGANAEGLQEAVNRWAKNALKIPSGFAVGHVRFTIEEENGTGTGIIDISLTDAEVFITVPKQS